MNAAFTICTPSYLPYAKALADSVCKYNPDYVFYIFYLETVQFSTNLSFFSPHILQKIEDLELEGIGEMKKRYSNFELCCALKPYIAEHILINQKKIKNLYYFDSDILVFNTLKIAEQTLNNHPILITPHILQSINEDGCNPSEEAIMRAGLYNAGFFAISNQQDSFPFLNWWKEKLFNKCFVNLQEGLFVDQIWLTTAPNYFSQICIFKNPGYNFAYWNFQERELTLTNEGYMINGTYPLIFMHYSGFDTAHSEYISKHQNRFTFENKPETKILFQKYIEEVFKNNIDNLIDIEKSEQQNQKADLKKVKKKKWFSFFTSKK